jgi:hypothetical protein
MHAGTRVLSPAEYSIEHIWPGNNLGRCAFPRADWDASYPDNWENATSVFFRAPAAKRLFIAALDETGYGLVQTATPEMRGRKFFYFGSADGGQNWMDYLARPGEGKYLEIQSGIAPTQNQRFVLAARAELEWTEAFAPLQLAPEAAHDPDYRAAVRRAGQSLDAVVPADEFARVDALLRIDARKPLDRRFAAGSAWGMRQESLLGRRLADGLDFAVNAPADFWDDSATGRPVAPANLRDVPQGSAVSAAWTSRVAENAGKHGQSWVHELVLAIAAVDRAETAAAAATIAGPHIDRSLALRPSWLGYRMQALLTADPDARSEAYRKAWQMDGAPAELAVEIAAHLMTDGQPGELKAFVDALPPQARDNERIVLARAVVAADSKEFEEAERLLLSRRYATIREGETLLSDLWVRIRRGRVEAALGRAPTPDEIRRDLGRHPLPRTLDLRMHTLEAT